MSVSVPAILKYLNDNNNNYIMDVENSNLPGRARKRRLDHLTWEEKIQRKKLKNRVAAQTSRDRKKAKLEQMEGALKDLFERNEKLAQECKRLKQENERLTTENAELHHSQSRVPCPNCAQNRPVECDAQKGSAESHPPPQGLARHSAAALKPQALRQLWKIVLACLLSQICSTNSTETSTSRLSKKSRRVSCKTSPQTWKHLLEKQLLKNPQRQIIQKIVLKKWWGRHQKSWNPVDVVTA